MRRQEQGFTLLELSISGAILLLLVSAIYGVLSRTTSSANDLMRMGLIQENGRRVLDGLAREIREADGAAIVITTTPDGSKAINFRVPTKYVALPVVWSTAIQYQYETSFLDHNNTQPVNRIVRIQDGVTQRLCDDVKQGGMTITRTGDNIVIRLTFVVTGERNKILESFVETSVTVRNNSS